MFFSTMKELVSHFTYDMSGYKPHLTQLNKTFRVSNDPVLRFYYTPVVISRLLSLLYFIEQSVNTYHIIPDINEMDLQVSKDYADIYRAILNKKDHDDQEKDVTVPKSNGASN